jgi:hypothetical protein
MGRIYLLVKSKIHFIKTMVDGRLELTKGFVIMIVKTLLFCEFSKANWRHHCPTPATKSEAQASR